MPSADGENNRSLLAVNGQLSREIEFDDKEQEELRHKLWS